MPKKTPTKMEIVRGFTNSPNLSPSEFTFGDRVLKVVDLKYDNYLRFLTLLGPMIEVMFGSVATSFGMSASQADAVNPQAIIKHLAYSLPELTCIVCNQTDESITVTECKSVLKSPFKMAEIVLKQIEQNKIIAEFADFFKQALPQMMTALRPSQ